MPTPVHALSDCERVLPGFVSQPINAASGAAFLAAGLWLSSKSPEEGALRAFGAALALVGVGSIAYHGPGGPTAKWVHDVGVTAPALVLGVLTLARRRQWLPATRMRVLAGLLAAVGAVLAVRPAWSARVAMTIIVAAAAGEFDAWARWRRLSRQRLVAAATGVAVLAGGAAVDVLSRTGAPWCRPDSLLQGHAAWHVLAATGLASYGWAVLRERHDV